MLQIYLESIEEILAKFQVNFVSKMLIIQFWKGIREKEREKEKKFFTVASFCLTNTAYM